jgi:hypothetical protein
MVKTFLYAEKYLKRTLFKKKAEAIFVREKFRLELVLDNLKFLTTLIAGICRMLSLPSDWQIMYIFLLSRLGAACREPDTTCSSSNNSKSTMLPTATTSHPRTSSRTLATRTTAQRDSTTAASCPQLATARYSDGLKQKLSFNFHKKKCGLAHPLLSIRNWFVSCANQQFPVYNFCFATKKRVIFCGNMKLWEIFSLRFEPIKAVLRIRDVYPGSDLFPTWIPDPNYLHPGSRIRVKEFKYFNPKKWFLSSRKYDPGCSSRIRMLTFYPSRIPDPGVKKAPDPGSGSATLKK